MATPIPSVPIVEEFQDVVKESVVEESVPMPTPVVDVQPLPKSEPQVQSEVQPEAEPSELQVLTALTPVDRLLITRRLKVKGALFLRGKKNRFFVRTPDQNLIYTVEEENSWWVGYFCYGLRPLQLRVKDNLGLEVMRIYRPYAFTTRVLPCQLQRMAVYAPPEYRIGSIHQLWSAIKPVYLIRNRNGDDVFYVRGPCITLSCFQDVQFQVVRPDGTPVGATCKRWEGITHALFFAPVTDRCGIIFEKDLLVEEKSLLLATTLLLDYMYYDI